MEQTKTRKFKRGNAFIFITPAGKGMVEIAGSNHSMMLDSNALPAFIKTAKLKEVQNG